MTDPAWTELSLFGDDKHHYPRNEILSCDPSQTTNGERVRDLATLGYLPEPVLDPCYGRGAMWTKYTPTSLHACDLDPAKSPTTGESVDFTALPFEDDSFGSCLFDPPYAYHGGLADTDHDERYGLNVYRTKAEQQALILDGARDCARVACEFLIIKGQDQVVAGSVRFQTIEVALFMESLGWRLKDRLGLLAYRPQPAGRRQLNSRSNVSWFSVFVPGSNDW